MPEKRMIYIASPYTIGNKIENVDYQIDMFIILFKLGFVPFAPLLSHYVNVVDEQGYDEWLEYDFEIIKRCDALLACLMEKISIGRDREIEFSKSINKPVFTTVKDLCDWANIKQNGLN